MSEKTDLCFVGEAVHTDYRLGILLGIGLGIGIGLALVVAREANGLVFGLSTHDAASLSMSLGVLATIAVIACAIPALRVARIEANAALKSE